MLKKVNRLLKLVVYTNLWVAFAIASFTYLSLLEFQELPLNYILFVFCSTIGAYNYMRMVQLPKELNEELNEDLNQKFWISKRFIQAIFFTLLFLGLALYFYISIFSFQLLFATLPAFVVALFYPLGFNQAFKSFSSLRNTPGLKLFLISISWSYISFLMPQFVFAKIEAFSIYEFLFRTGLVAALVIPFDIRDMDLDSDEMQTLPQKIGAKRAKWVACVLMAIYIIWKWLHYLAFDGSQLLAISWLVSGLLGIWLISRMNSKRSELYCGFWVESIPIFTALVLFVLSHWIASGTF